MAPRKIIKSDCYLTPYVEIKLKKKEKKKNTVSIGAIHLINIL